MKKKKKKSYSHLESPIIFYGNGSNCPEACSTKSFSIDFVENQKKKKKYKIQN